MDKRYVKNTFETEMVGFVDGLGVRIKGREESRMTPRSSNEWTVVSFHEVGNRRVGWVGRWTESHIRSHPPNMRHLPQGH